MRYPLVAMGKAHLLACGACWQAAGDGVPSSGNGGDASMSALTVVGPVLVCMGAICGVAVVYLAVTSLRDRSRRRGEDAARRGL